MGSWNCNFPSFWEIMTDRPTNQQIHMGVDTKVTPTPITVFILLCQSWEEYRSPCAFTHPDGCLGCPARGLGLVLDPALLHLWARIFSIRHQQATSMYIHPLIWLSYGCIKYWVLYFENIHWKCNFHLIPCVRQSVCHNFLKGWEVTLPKIIPIIWRNKIVELL